MQTPAATHPAGCLAVNGILWNDCAIKNKMPRKLLGVGVSYIGKGPTVTKIIKCCISLP